MMVENWKIYKKGWKINEEERKRNMNEDNSGSKEKWIKMREEGQWEYMNGGGE